MSHSSLQFEPAPTSGSRLGSGDVGQPPAAFPARIPRFQPLVRAREPAPRRGSRWLLAGLVFALASVAWFWLELTSLPLFG